MKTENDKLGCPGCVYANKWQLTRGHGCCEYPTYIKIDLKTGKCGVKRNAK